MILNKANADFLFWYNTMTNTAIDEYSFPLLTNFDTNEFQEYYANGMDVHEAIQAHQEKTEGVSY